MKAKSIFREETTCHKAHQKGKVVTYSIHKKQILSPMIFIWMGNALM